MATAEKKTFHHIFDVNELQSENLTIGVLGCGAFGTAMAVVASRNGHSVKIYSRNEDTVRSINENKVNDRYLTDYTLPDNVSAVRTVEEAVEGSQLLIHCIPAQKTPQFIREQLSPVLTALDRRDILFCSTSKGLFLETNQLLSEAMEDAFRGESGDSVPPFAFLSGPSFAKEMMDQAPTAVVVASKLLYHAVFIQRAMSNLTFRVYTSQDTVGVELGGALKNPLAIGAGLIQGMGFGINTIAAYVTRSSNELTKLCVAMGGQPQTISGLAGIGDLMLTAFGSLSRNMRFGMRVAKGERKEDIMEEFTVEGVPTAAVAAVFADACGLDLPLFRAINAIISGELAIQDAQQALMGRPLSMEHK